MRRAPLLLLTLLSLGCGAKTGLEVAPGMDAGRRDAGAPPPRPDAGRPDAGPVPEECAPQPVALARRRVEVLFVIDRSSSMTQTPDGEIAETPIESRWIALREALREALVGRDDGLGVGALFYPDTFFFGGNIESNCQVREEIDLPIAFGNGEALIAQFAERSPPQGATPTARALEVADRLFSSRGDREVARFVVLATDGGPNCNPEPATPPPACVCTGLDPMTCDPEENPTAAYTCLDDEGSLTAVERIANDDVPVFVVGITDEEDRPELRETLDVLARAGGRPRSGETAYYDVTSAGELAEAMGTITDSISRCTFYLPLGWRVSTVEELSIEGVPLGRDPTRREGWDLTDAERGEVTLYGAACDAGAAPGVTITALPACAG